ncbi:MAG: hypothetical protein IPP33_07845 [Flavobacteriales bacterium]|nr:hypothetical protein [Flavobacteriales bacterium]
MVLRLGTTAIVLCLVAATQAQIDIFIRTDTVRVPKVMVDVDGQPIGLGGWSRDTLSMKILVDGKEVDPKSKKGRRALEEAGGAESDAAELSNLDQLIGDMIQAFRDLPSGDSLHRAMERDQALWVKARSIHCGNEAAATSPTEKLKVVACLKWAAECRLEDLLALYDSITK